MKEKPDRSDIASAWECIEERWNQAPTYSTDLDQQSPRRVVGPALLDLREEIAGLKIHIGVLENRLATKVSDRDLDRRLEHKCPANTPYMEHLESRIARLESPKDWLYWTVEQEKSWDKDLRLRVTRTEPGHPDLLVKIPYEVLRWELSSDGIEIKKFDKP